MKNILVTGGSGFFGGVLKRRLLAEGYAVTSLDLFPDPDRHPSLTSIQGDIRDKALLDKTFSRGHFETVFHVAAMLAHDQVDEHALWASNVDGTRNIAEACRTHGVPKLVFTSTNCLWASNLGHQVREDEPPNPIEPYGRSKLAAEQLLHRYEPDLQVVQFIYAQDLATACLQTLEYSQSDLFNIGSENVASLRQVYEAVIAAAGTHARVASLPKGPTIAAMKLAHKLGVSPLGPYHYRMIAEDFIFDTTRIRQRLGWRPTLTNQQMMIEAFRYYAAQRDEINARKDVSAHSRPARMGIIRLLKWIS